MKRADRWFEVHNRVLIDGTPEGARLSAVEDRVDQADWNEHERMLRELDNMRLVVGEAHAV